MKKASVQQLQPTRPESFQKEPSAPRPRSRSDVMTYDDVHERIAAMESETARKLARVSTNSWMRVFKHAGSDAASDLDPLVFDANLARYELDREFTELSPNSRNNRRSGIRRVSTLFADSCLVEVTSSRQVGNPYWDLVYEAMQTAKLKKRRRKDLMKKRSLGQMPRTREDVLKVAQELGINPEDLLRHVWLWQPTLLFNLNNPEYQWNDAHHELTKMHFALTPLPPEVEDRALPFFTWRRASSPRQLAVELLDGSIVELKRSGAWTLREGQAANEVAPTEKVQREFYESFFGFCCLPSDARDPKMRGLGIPKENLRLAHLFVGKNVTAYCEFQKVRNGRFDHTGLKKVREDWSLLIGSKKSYGRHAQRANYHDLLDVLGDEATPDTPAAWNAWCDEQQKVLENWIDVETEGRTGKNKYRQARSAEDNLQVLFERRKPIEEVVWPTVYWLKDNRPPAHYPLYDRIVHESKMFATASLTAEPLRLENWLNMEWGKNLFKRDNKWLINIQYGYFKNRRVLYKPYRSTIESTATEFFDSWHKLWTDAFGYDPLAPEHRRLKSYVHSPWKRGGVVKKPSHGLLRDRLRYLQTVWGITVGPNAARHIWATDWLKRHPEDYVTVAGKLNDSMPTVMAMYGHLSSADHSARADDANAGASDRAKEHLRDHLRRNKKK